MTESKAVITDLTTWMYFPTTMFAVGAPCVFMLFAPKEYVDLILRSSNLPDELNPWIGLTFMYVSSCFAIYILRLMWRLIKKPFQRNPSPLDWDDNVPGRS